MLTLPWATKVSQIGLLILTFLLTVIYIKMYSHKDRSINCILLVNKLLKQLKIRFYWEKYSIYLFPWKSGKPLKILLLKSQMRWLIKVKKEKYASIQITFFHHPTNDEKNYANPCICPELWFYYINLIG
jgi:hypothetical protein